MKSIYEKNGINAVISANGKMAVLGSSLLEEKVQHYVDMGELMKAAGQVIVRLTGSENGCPTN